MKRKASDLSRKNCSRYKSSTLRSTTTSTPTDNEHINSECDSENQKNKSGEDGVDDKDHVLQKKQKLGSEEFLEGNIPLHSQNPDPELVAYVKRFINETNLLQKELAEELHVRYTENFEPLHVFVSFVFFISLCSFFGIFCL
jgi:hypothetical protein